MGRRSSFKYQEWFERTYPDLTGYGAWLKGGELNTLPPGAYDTHPLRVLFARLSTYDDVAASFTHLLLYQIAAATPGVFPDLAYLPNERDARIFARDQVPWLIGTGTKYGPEYFQVIGFSNSIVQELINIPSFLAKSDIPLSRRERLERPDIPLILLGGANASFTSSVWGPDALVDGIFIGTDTARIQEILTICADGYKNDTAKSAVLSELEKVSGFYPADDPAKARNRKTVGTPAAITPLDTAPVPYHLEAMGTGHLQISEGCRAHCSFCAENWTRKPYREVGETELMTRALTLKTGMGLESVDVYSFNFNMHTCFYELLWDLIPLFRSIGLKSQRLDMLTQDPSMVACQVACGKVSFSAGLEGISPRLRKYLNKNLSEEALRTSLELIFKAKARELKVFLLSTGIEESADYAAFDVLLDFIRAAKSRCGSGTRVIFSITPLVRFPATPLAFSPAPAKEAHDRVIAEITRRAITHGFEARAAMDTREHLVSQILTRADNPGILPALQEAIRDTSFVYYRGIPADFFQAFIRRLQDKGLTTEMLLAGASQGQGAPPAWTALDTGIAFETLETIYQKNKIYTETGAPLDAIRMEPPRHAPQEYRDRVRAAAQDRALYSFRFTIADQGRGLPRRYIGIVLASALMRAIPDLARQYQGYVSSYWSKLEDTPMWMTGDDIITLAWHAAALPLLTAGLADKKKLRAINSCLGGWGTLTGPGGTGIPSVDITVRGPFPAAIDTYCKKHGLKHTLVKDRSRGVSILQFAKDALKKHIITSCTVLPGDTETIELVPGPKFDPADFARHAYPAAGKNGWVRVSMVARFT